MKVDGEPAPNSLAVDSGPDDAALVAQVLAGHRDRFKHLVRRYHRRLYFYAARKMTDDAEAEDLVQKTFVTAFHRLGDFDPRQPFLPWLRGILLNHCRHAWRDRELPLETDVLGALGASPSGPEEDVEMRERLGQIAEGMNDLLTPHQRRVLVALAVNGVPIDVLAERLSTTRGALYKTLHDARAKLRAHLEETS